MNIVIGCRMKHRDLIRETSRKLLELGLTPLFPNLDHSEEQGDPAKTLEEKKKLMDDHFAAIDEADVVYFLTPEGYMGTSCKMELGYALARNKPIYFSEPTNDLGLDCYALGFIGTDSLQEFFSLNID